MSKKRRATKNVAVAKQVLLDTIGKLKETNNIDEVNELSHQGWHLLMAYANGEDITFILGLEKIKSQAPQQVQS